MPDTDKSLTFDDVVAGDMTWGAVIRSWKPDATNEECDEIYAKMHKKAYNDAVVGRRPYVTDFMIFTRIKYDYFKHFKQ